MPQPIICLDEEVRHFVERFRPLYSKPQYQYFVTVLARIVATPGEHWRSSARDPASSSSLLA